MHRSLGGLAGSSGRSRLRGRGESLSAPHGAPPRWNAPRGGVGQARRRQHASFTRRIRQRRCLPARAASRIVSRSRDVSSRTVPAERMKIFIATAKLDDIRWAHSHGLVDGVLTTPTLLTAEVHPAGANDLLAEICGVAAFPVAVSVGAVNANDVYRDARELAKLSDSIIVQIPFVEDAIEAIRRLS